MKREKLTCTSCQEVCALIPLVDFLGKVMGSHCEVVLHDITVPEQSVIAITNGHVSGRTVGAPITGYALGLLHDNAHLDRDFIHNYDGSLKNGKRVRSSTFFIKNSCRKVVGMLCVNIDTDMLECFRRGLDEIVCGYFNTSLMKCMGAPSATVAPALPSTSPPPPPAPNPTPKPITAEPVETFSASVEELMRSLMGEALAAYQVLPERFSPSERSDVVRFLYRRGFYQLRGAVEYTANSLGISEVTVYRYLKNIQSGSKRTQPGVG